MTWLEAFLAVTTWWQILGMVVGLVWLIYCLALNNNPRGQ